MGHPGRPAVLLVAITATLFASAGALIGWWWVEAKRDENASLDCLFRTVPDGREAEPAQVGARRVCVYRGESGPIVRTVPATTDIGRTDAAGVISVVALLAAGVGAVAATAGLTFGWLLVRLVRRRGALRAV